MRRPCLSFELTIPALLAAALLISEPAFVQEGSEEGPFRREFGDYTVIYSVARSDTLPEQTARRHGLMADPNAALLNVTVQRDGMNVPAAISASATNLARQRREIEMRETVANDLVSYVGVVAIADREVLDFAVEILPRGAEEPFGFEFRETFLPQPRADELR